MLPALTRQERDKILQQSTDEMMCQIAALLPPAYRGVYADHPRLAELLQQRPFPGLKGICPITIGLTMAISSPKRAI